MDKSSLSRRSFLKISGVTTLGLVTAACAKTIKTALPTPSSTRPTLTATRPPATATQPPPTETHLAPTVIPSPEIPGLPIFMRYNQVGHLPQETKLALVMTSADLHGQSFQVIAGDHVVFSAPLGKDRGAYGVYDHLYELDFSQVSQPGTYRLDVLGTTGTVKIDEQAYANLLPTSLQFFQVQRCGDTHPAGHKPCHLNDGVAASGALTGKRIDVSGGWHDAGDYMKFLITTGYTTLLMLSAYQRHPEVFSDPQKPAAVPDVLQEARIGLDWMFKMWDPQHEILYYQVSDATDHDKWRMPEDDKLPRTVWACEPGKGANVAGKVAAALALAAAIWGNTQSPFRDQDLADRYLSTAKELYTWGQGQPLAQPSIPVDFYEEVSWQDDLALAAVELYRTTGEAKYLKQAIDYAQGAGAFEGLGWADLHALAHYEISRLDPTYIPTAKQLLAANLEADQTNADRQPFRAGVADFHWGSNETMSNIALVALWYEDLTKDTTYHALAQAQRDFILGNNPWGVCWVSGAGENWPKHPHHQIADLTGNALTGFWDEGAVPLDVFKADGPKDLRKADGYAAFQTDTAVYHDDTEDWTTNEPTITMNAAGIALTAWYATMK